MIVSLLTTCMNFNKNKTSEKANKKKAPSVGKTPAGPRLQQRFRAHRRFNFTTHYTCIHGHLGTTPPAEVELDVHRFHVVRVLGDAPWDAT